MWEEVGFYLGFASVWKCFLEAQQEQKCVLIIKGISFLSLMRLSSRALSHLSHLTESISSFPISNGPGKWHDLSMDIKIDWLSGPGGVEVDISQLLYRIRARYKATCATIGVRPRLIPSGVSNDVNSSMAEVGQSMDIGEGNSARDKKPPVWSFTAVASKPGGLAF